MGRVVPFPTRLTNLSIPEPNSGCRLFLGRIRKDGYGSIRYRGKMCLAHKAAYEDAVGPVADGHELDHLCSVRACTELTHLQPVIHRVNVLRGSSKAAANAIKTECANGHPFDERNTYTGGKRRTCRTCNAASQRRRQASKRVA